MSDEDVIRRRLLIDGDGTGDDRRLNILLKSFILWCNSPTTMTDDDIQLDRMLGQLSQSELALKKSRLMAKSSSAELDHYEELRKSILERLQTAKSNIADAQEAFTKAKEVRKNRVQYDMLASIIMAQPDRKEMMDKLEQIKGELAELESKRHELDEKLALRRKRLHLLSVAIHDFTEDSIGEQQRELASNLATDADISLEPFDLEDEDEQAMNQD